MLCGWAKAHDDSFLLTGSEPRGLPKQMLRQSRGCWLFHRASSELSHLRQRSDSAAGASPDRSSRQLDTIMVWSSACASGYDHPSGTACHLRTLAEARQEAV